MATNKKLSAVIAIGGAISSSLRSTFGDVKGRLVDLGKTVTDLEKRQRLLGRTIQEFGRAGKDVTGMRNRYAELTQQLDRARQAQERLATAQARAAKIGGFVKGAGVAVGAAAAAGAVVGRPLVRAAISRENEINLIKNTGASKEETAELVHAAETAKQFGVSVTEAIHVVGQLRAAFGDAHHAVEALPLALKAKSGLQLYDRLHGSALADGDSAYTLAKIAEERGGAKSPEALAAKFNWAFKGLTGSGGHVSVDQWLNAIRSGKGAVRAMDDASFFGDTFLMQSMGADRYGTASSSLSNGWVAGRATHSALNRMMEIGLLDKDKVKFDKIGKVKSAVGALKDSQLFIKDPQAWVDKYLIPAMKSRGVDVTDAAQVNEFAAQIASNSNASAILVNRVLDSQNIAKDRRNVHKANGVRESDEQNKESSAGKIENARKRLNDVEERMGAVILPVLATSLEKVATVLEWLNRKAEESPAVFKALTWGLIGVTTAVGGLTAVSLTSKLAIEPLAGVLNAVGAAAPGAVGGLSKLLGLVGAAAGIAGTVVTLANTTTDEEDSEIRNGKARWAALRAKYPQSVIDAARKKYQPWYEVGQGYAAENEAWLKRYTSENPLPAVPPKATTTTASTTDARQYSFTINQAPGQDSKALADEIERRLGIKAGIKNRSSMFDGVN
ncbi:putative tail protein [Ralstonia phage phiRSP]|uniref:Putative tail protein n=1 Tax=Ralstonia phage phiRSP TaxID=2201420 RepID=A0A345ANU0_9CAUD|nr:putative tail protein [Ralstonia phage phiRSP]AXF38229.1 putative tail protein [Ralstonia phage phiRSP]